MTKLLTIVTIASALEPCAPWKRMIVATSVDNVISTSRPLVDEIKSAFANLELNDEMPTLRDVP